MDYFSKWVEIYPIANKAAISITDWLWRELVPRFSKLRWLQIDSRQEFQGGFADLCDALGISIKATLAGYAKSNRLVKRINREFKAAVRKYALLHEGLWFGWLPEVLVG